MPFISSKYNVGKYKLEYACSCLPSSFLSNESIESISVVRHRVEEKFYEGMCREMGGIGKLDWDIIADSQWG